MRSRLQNIGLVVAILLLIGFGLAYSQVLGPNEVYAGQSFRIAADHNGTDTTTYELRQGTAVVSTVPRSQLANGTIIFPATVQAAVGTYPYFVVATGPGGSTSTGPYNVVVRNRAPFGFTNTRIIREGEPGFEQ